VDSLIRHERYAAENSIESNSKRISSYRSEPDDYDVKLNSSISISYCIYIYFVKREKLKDRLTIRLNDYDGPKGIHTYIGAKIGSRLV
jgi:hypothetical protein